MKNTSCACANLLLVLFSWAALMYFTSSEGTTSTAYARDVSSAMSITHGKAKRISLNCPFTIRSIGKNIRAMESVAISIGLNSSLALSIAASTRLCPAAILSIYPSMVMMESSTIIPKTTINAARVTVFNGMPATNMIATATAVQTGTPDDAMRAGLRGKSMSMTRMTTMIDIIKSLRKLSTATYTIFGWSVTRVRCTLEGSSFWNDFRTFSTLYPKFTISRPSFMLTATKRVLFPLNLMDDDRCFILV